MSSLNKIQLIGRLGKDPEVRHTEGGNTLATFSVATSEIYKSGGEKIEDTEWHNIVLWNKTAEIAEKLLHKGDMVYIEGKLKTKSWEEDGVRRYATDVVGYKLLMLTPKGSSSPSSQGYAEPPERSTQENESDDSSF